MVLSCRPYALFVLAAAVGVTMLTSGCQTTSRNESASANAATPAVSAKPKDDASLPAEERFDSIEAARKRFEAAGIQVGQPLPDLTVYDLNGKPARLRELCDGQRWGTVIVTVSLTCPIARRQCPALQQLMMDHDVAANVIYLYTIDAHPKTDESPYNPGHEWITESNEKESILVRQPTNLQERLVLARELNQRLGNKVAMIVDGMDNAAWTALGGAPNLALLVDAQGKVTAKQGWLDGDQLIATLNSR